MKHDKLRRLIFMALCCDMGIFSKKLIVPAANLLTDALHIPGGVGTGFSLMFIVIAAVFIPKPGAALLMGVVQSGIALCMGTVGSMGALAPIGYILPAAAIDILLFAARKAELGRTESLVLINSAASVAASLAANFIVFRLSGIVLALYLCVSALSGAVCGLLAVSAVSKLTPVIGKDVFYEEGRYRGHCAARTADSAACCRASDRANA